MKILYVLDDTLDKSDGVQQCVISIGEYMRSLGHEVHYMVAETARTDLTNVHAVAQYISLRFNGNSVRTPRPTSKKTIRRVLADISPDVIHIQMPYSPFFGSKVVACAGKNVRVVGTWHTFPTGGLQRLSHYPLYWMIGHTLLRVEQTIGVSKPTADFADSIYHTKSIVIPNAVPTEWFKLVVPKSNRKKLVFLGRFDERKGPILLIRALYELKTNGFDLDSIDIVMGGKGPDLEKCKKLSIDLGLNIEFTGFVEEDDKPVLLASADVTVFPSTGGEAFGISVVEAMASGASVVLAGDNAGYRSILGEKPELLFDPLDTKSFAQKLSVFLSMPEKQSEEIKEWVKTSAEQYDVKNVCNQLLTVYKQKY